jgi:hypothetical protein
MQQPRQSQARHASTRQYSINTRLFELPHVRQQPRVDDLRAPPRDELVKAMRQASGSEDRYVNLMQPDAATHQKSSAHASTAAAMPAAFSSGLDVTYWPRSWRQRGICQTARRQVTHAAAHGAAVPERLERA